MSRLADDGEKPVAERPKEEKERAKCPKCGALWSGRGRICNACGFMRPVFNMVEETPGELVELGKAGIPEAVRMRWFDEFRSILELRGKNINAAAFLYRDKFGEMPPLRWNNRPIGNTVSAEVAGFEQSRRIAFAKGRAKAQPQRKAA